MKRRDVIAGLLVSSTLGSAHAQQIKKYRIAILDPATPVEVMNESTGPQYPLWAPLFKELRRLGYVEGQNLLVERYSGRLNYTPDLARTVVASNPDLIFSVTNFVAHDLITMTDRIPIVGIAADPIRFGLARNMARPGGNFTGVSPDVAGYEVWGKRLELLRELVPRMSTVGLLVTRVQWESFFRIGFEKLEPEFGIAVVGPFLERPLTEEEFRRVFAAMSQEGADALFVSEIAEVFVHKPLIVELAQKYRLPAVYAYRYDAQIGGLMAYDYGLSDLGRIMADQIDQILKGTKPGDIPIYQAEKFTLTINVKTANALGLTVPASLLARADEVIE
jgi:putative tryptophan/tyrosine transport system substrate-binding protein